MIPCENISKSVCVKLVCMMLSTKRSFLANKHIKHAYLIEIMIMQCLFCAQPQSTQLIIPTIISNQTSTLNSRYTTELQIHVYSVANLHFYLDVWWVSQRLTWALSQAELHIPFLPAPFSPAKQVPLGSRSWSVLPTCPLQPEASQHWVSKEARQGSRRYPWEGCRCLNEGGRKVGSEQ